MDALRFEEGSDLDKADRELRRAAHAYHMASAEGKIAARQELRLAAIRFVAEAQALAYAEEG